MVTTNINILKHVLVNIAEESSEVSKEALKAFRYTILDRNLSNGKQLNHGNSLIEEFYQLAGLIEHLQNGGFLPVITEEEINLIKTGKINRMMDNLSKYKDI